MATYAELYDLRTNTTLQNKIAVALVIEAQTILAGSPTEAQATWAKSVATNPKGAAETAMNLVLAANKAATVENITSATDESIQTAVGNVVAGLIVGS